MSGPFDANNLDALLSQMQSLQEHLEQANSASTAAGFKGSAGGGKVTIEVAGDFEFSAVRIDPTVVDAQGVDLLEDLVLAAVHDAVQQLNQARTSAVGDVVSNTLSELLGANQELFGGSAPEIGDEDDSTESPPH